MSTVPSVTSGKSTFQTPVEIVKYSAVSIFKSRIFKLVAGTAALEAVVVWILPLASSLLHKTVNPLLVKSLFGTVLLGSAILGIRMRKEMIYEISLLYTIYGGNPWWTEINEHIILGAIPLKHQLETLQKLGVTHVITLLEPFELRPGIVTPIQPEQWQAAGIRHTLIKAPDFEGVKPNLIDQAVQLLKNNPDAKFYIHCKAGRGRSATIVLCHFKKNGTAEEKSKTKEEIYATLKSLRPQINLNKHQIAAAQTYLDKRDSFEF